MVEEISEKQGRKEKLYPAKYRVPEMSKEI